jgi:hypothetical protein
MNFTFAMLAVLVMMVVVVVVVELLLLPVPYCSKLILLVLLTVQMLQTFC